MTQSFWNSFEKQAEKLTASARNALSSSEFAEPKERKYPIEDKAHARAAKSRVAQFGTPAEKAIIDRKADAVLDK